MSFEMYATFAETMIHHWIDRESPKPEKVSRKAIEKDLLESISNGEVPIDLKMAMVHTILHTEKFTTFWLDQMREHGFGNHQIARYEVTKKLLAQLEAAEIQASVSDAENDIPPRGRSPIRRGSTPPASVRSSRELSLAATPVMASSSTGKRKFDDVGNSDEPDCGKPHKAGMTGGKTIPKSLLLALYLAPAVLRRFPHQQEEVESEEE